MTNIQDYLFTVVEQLWEAITLIHFCEREREVKEFDWSCEVVHSNTLSVSQ